MLAGFRPADVLKRLKVFALTTARACASCLLGPQPKRFDSDNEHSGH